jgi:hypothetical protein
MTEPAGVRRVGVFDVDAVEDWEGAGRGVGWEEGGVIVRGVETRATFARLVDGSTPPPSTGAAGASRASLAAILSFFVLNFFFFFLSPA